MLRGMVLMGDKNRMMVESEKVERYDDDGKPEEPEKKSGLGRLTAHI